MSYPTDKLLSFNYSELKRSISIALHRSRTRRKPRSGAASATVVKLSTCRGMTSRKNAAATDDCTKLYSCGRAPQQQQHQSSSMTASYYRNSDDDDDDRMLFPALLQAANGGSAGGGPFQKAAVVYEFSCTGIDRPPSSAAAADFCDLLPPPPPVSSADKTSGPPTYGSIPTSADAFQQLVDLAQCRRAVAVPPPYCEYSRLALQDSTESECSCQQTTATTMTSRMRPTGGCLRYESVPTSQSATACSAYDVFSQQQQQQSSTTAAMTSQLVLYETANVGRCMTDSPVLRLQPPSRSSAATADYQHFASTASQSAANGTSSSSSGREDGGVVRMQVGMIYAPPPATSSGDDTGVASIGVMSNGVDSGDVIVFD